MSRRLTLIGALLAIPLSPFALCAQALARDGDALRLRYALGARGDSAQTSLRVRVRGANQWSTPYSPTHQLTTAEDSGDLRVTLTGLSTGDVQLFLPLRRGLLG